MRRDRRLIAARRAVPPDISGLQVRRRCDELVAVPHAGCEARLIVRRVLSRMRTAVHPDRHRRARFPCTDHPRLDFSGNRIGNRPHTQAERTGRDVPLRLEPAGAFGHRDRGLRKAQRLGAARFVERQARPVVRIRTAPSLERVFVVDRGPRSRQIDFGHQRHGGHCDQRERENRFIANHVESPYQVAEQSLGFHFASLGSFLNCEVITNGCRRYIGSVVLIVTTSSGDPSGCVISS